MKPKVSDSVRVGEFLLYRGGDKAKVMAVADGWVMARYKDCVPFTIFIHDIDGRHPVWRTT